MIQLKNIYKHYRYGSQESEVLSGVSLEVSKGDFVSIMGLSGSGKSTLINILGLLDDDFTGDYLLNGENIGNLDEEMLAVFRNQYIGFIFQQFHLVDEYTALENILLPSIYAKENLDMSYIKNLAKQLNILDKLEDYPQNLSGGQKQRVAIIRALANRPQFLIADEPTGALDEENRNEILEIFQELNQNGTTIILVTHDKAVADYSKKRYVMKHGHLELEG